MSNNDKKNNNDIKNRNPNGKKKQANKPTFDLAILCQFQKEDEPMIRSWLQHHIWQGVQHFFLIENVSADGDSLKQILQEFIDNNVVTHFTRSGKRVDNYRWVFDKIKQKTNWLAICDVNDFFYGVNKKLVKMIKQHVGSQFDMIVCNGFCYKCENQIELSNPSCTALRRHPLLSKSTKYIFRVKSVIHPSQIWLECLLYPHSKMMMTKHPRTLFTNTIVRLNHYETTLCENDEQNNQYLIDTTLKDLVERTPENY